MRARTQARTYAEYHENGKCRRARAQMRAVARESPVLALAPERRLRDRRDTAVSGSVRERAQEFYLRRASALDPCNKVAAHQSI